mgnify:CR=1 FL=1
MSFSSDFPIELHGVDLASKVYTVSSLRDMTFILSIVFYGFIKCIINVIKKFDGTIINIHPSLLPKYKGLHTHRRAILNKDNFAGCTVHYVTAKLDSGKIILQKEVKISEKDTPTSLAKKVLRQEHKLYPAAIKKIFN